ncbi:MAG: 3-phosphoshikimate 1-carboxyvinyltransferase, partial [Actinomycetota bacterium]
REMRARILPGGAFGGTVSVPGDKSIAHRWLILAALASGRSELRGLPGALDVARTARVVGDVFPGSATELHAWQAHMEVEGSLQGGSVLEVEGSAREGMREPQGPLECGNSGTTMRLMAGVLGAGPFRSVLSGDESLRRRPMERVAEPLRRMGASIETSEGCAPMTITGGPLRGIRWEMPVPSAQVKSAIILASLGAEGETEIVEPAPTRDHTERALAFLGAPIVSDGGRIRVRAFRPQGFGGLVPGDPSSAAFLLAGAAIGGSELVVTGVGLNPTRTRFLAVLRRLGARVEEEPSTTSVGEPAGRIRIDRAGRLEGTAVSAGELPLVIDEVPALAVVAAHGDGETRFEGAAELRVKESDRLSGLAEGIRELGGEAEIQGDALVVAGGGLVGGSADARGDHRLAMALAVGALGASGPCEVDGIESASISFPGFVPTMRRLGASVEVEG